MAGFGSTGALSPSGRGGIGGNGGPDGGGVINGPHSQSATEGNEPSAYQVGVMTPWGIQKPMQAKSAPTPMPMADSGGGGGGGGIAAPVMAPQAAAEAPASEPPSLKGLQGLSGGGSGPTPPGEITAPGSMRQGIGRRVPPSLAALLKPRVY